MTKQLYRSATNRMIAGVCGGLADFFDVDATLFRVLFVAVTFLGGAGVLVYVILWIIIPLPTSNTQDSKMRMEEFKNEAKGFVQHTAEQMKQGNQGAHATSASRTQRALAIGLIVLGGLIIVKNFLPHISYTYVWPVILVVVGVWLLWQAQPTSVKSANDTQEISEKKVTDAKTEEKKDNSTSATPPST